MTGEEFKACRESLGLSQAQLGRLMGMTNMQISKIERGERGVTRMHEAFILYLLKHEGTETADPFPFTREEGELLLRFKEWLESQKENE